MWERCDLLVQTLSPDGKLALAARFVDGSIDQTADEFAVVDVKTGADVVALDLPPSGLEFGVPRAPTFQWFVESWEPDGSALVHVMYEGCPVRIRTATSRHNCARSPGATCRRVRASWCPTP